jgi:hypothetical protein
MKHSYTSLISVFIAFFLFLACEKDADLKTPDFNPKLVIHSFISPEDTVLKVHVGTNRNTSGKLIDYPNPITATVFMMDEDRLIAFTKGDTSVWTAKYQIEAGKKYKLMVKCPGYPDIIAETKVPENNNIPLSLDTITENFSSEYGNYSHKKLTVKFDDTAGKKNYYNIMASLYSEGYAFGTTEIYKTNNILSYESQDNFFGYTPNKIITDNLIDGQAITTRFIFYFNLNEHLIKSEIIVKVLETDDDYYTYHNSLKNYRGTDEIFTEYSPLYSNIQGGIGIFSSYVVHKKVLVLK